MTKMLTFGDGAALNARLDGPEAAKAIVVLGHGSGSNLDVPVMTGIAGGLVRAGLAVLRFNYPYSQADDFVPYTDMPTDSPEVLMRVYRQAMALAVATMPDTPMIAAGHSLSSLAIAHLSAPELEPAIGRIFLGYPSKNEKAKEDLLLQVPHPTLVVQGTEDDYGPQDTLSRMEGASDGLQFAWIAEAGHLFERNGALADATFDEIAGEIACFIEGLLS